MPVMKKTSTNDRSTVSAAGNTSKKTEVRRASASGIEYDESQSKSERTFTTVTGRSLSHSDTSQLTEYTLTRSDAEFTSSSSESASAHTQVNDGLSNSRSRASLRSQQNTVDKDLELSDDEELFDNVVPAEYDDNDDDNVNNHKDDDDDDDENGDDNVNNHNDDDDDDDDDGHHSGTSGRNSAIIRNLNKMRLETISEHPQTESQSSSSSFQFSMNLGRSVSFAELDQMDRPHRMEAVLKQVLIKQCQLEREGARGRVLRGVERLGAIWGGSGRDSWMGQSTSVRELEAKFKQLSDAIEQIEDERTKLNNRVRAVRRKTTGSFCLKPVNSRRSVVTKIETDNLAACNDQQAGGTSEEQSLADHNNQLLQFKISLQQLKKQKQEVLEKLDKLKQERACHNSAIKLIQKEDDSKYNDNPIFVDRYLLLSMIGYGGFSEIYKAFDIKTCQFVACKIQQLNSTWGPNEITRQLKRMGREFQIQKIVQHPNIIRQLDCFEINSTAFCSVLQYFEGPDLGQMIRQKGHLAEDQARIILIQIITALKYLNSLNPSIIHYDIKPSNIMLSSTLHVMVTDFGLSKMMFSRNDDIDLTSVGAGTYWYLPPECFVHGRQPPKISTKVDVWSTGIVYYQMLYGMKPFGNDKSQTELISNNFMLQLPALVFPAKPAVSEAAKKFITRCLIVNKEERPDVLELSKDPYLNTKK